MRIGFFQIYFIEFGFDILLKFGECTEWLELTKTDYPQVIGNNILLYRETEYMAIAGKVPAFAELDKKITRLATEAYRNLGRSVSVLYRFRCMVIKLLGNSSNVRYVDHGFLRSDFRG